MTTKKIKYAKWGLNSRRAMEVFGIIALGNEIVYSTMGDGMQIYFHALPDGKWECNWNRHSHNEGDRFTFSSDSQFRAKFFASLRKILPKVLDISQTTVNEFIAKKIAENKETHLPFTNQCEKSEARISQRNSLHK